MLISVVLLLYRLLYRTLTLLLCTVRFDTMSFNKRIAQKIGTRFSMHYDFIRY